MKYTEEQKQEFVNLAAEVGLQRARRELGYPSSWLNGRRWCDERGVVVERDELMQRARAQREFYKDEELLLANQDIIERAQSMVKDDNLSPQDLEKLSATLKRCGDQIRTIQGKNVSQESETDKNIAELLHKFEQSQAKDSI